VLGKPIGIFLAASLAVRLGIAVKPAEYTWRQLLGAGTLAGIGFTMSLFIASHAFPSDADFAAAKISIFLASLVAGSLGALILWSRADLDKELTVTSRLRRTAAPPSGSPAGSFGDQGG